jgi:hypothetical protein
MKRNSTLPRHSKSFIPSLRIPSPLCACGCPKLSTKSHSASKHSVRSALDNLRSRCSTAGSMVRGLLKHFPELRSCNGDQLLRSLKLSIPLISGFIQPSDFFGHHSVFAPSIIGRFHFHLAQSDDVGAADNPDVLTSGGSSEPPAQILLGFRYRQSFHKAFIESLIGFCQRKECSRTGDEKVRGYKNGGTD